MEQTTRLVIVARMDRTETMSTREGITKKLRHVSASPRKTPVDDRVKEMTAHGQWAQPLAISCSCANPYYPWQRSTNENTTGLLRLDVPQDRNVSGYSQGEPNAAVRCLDTHPRTCLDVATPLELYTHLRHHSPVARRT